MIPKRVWIEMMDTSEEDACDVIVEMEDGVLYTAVCVTLSWLGRQMDLSYHVSEQLADTPPVRCATLETPHIIVEDLARDTLEDIVDNMIALDTFEGFFTQVTEEEPDGRTTSQGKRATTEVAAVVMSDVLTVSGDD